MIQADSAIVILFDMFSLTLSCEDCNPWVFRLGATYTPPALLASLKYAYSPCVLSSFLRSCCWLILFFFSSFPSFDFDFGHRLFHPVFFLWVLCCLLGFAFCWDSFNIWYIYISWYVRTLISPSFLSEVYDLFQLLHVSSCVFICFPPEVIFRSRVIGACPVTTDCIVAMSYCENNNNIIRGRFNKKPSSKCHLRNK